MNCTLKVGLKTFGVLFYINAFVTPVFTVAFRPESRSHSYSYALSIHDEIRRVKTGFGFNICYETPSKRP